MLTLSLRQPTSIFCFCLHLTDFVRHQSIPIQSMSADIFSFKEDIYVAMAAPNSNSCVVMEWDHIELNFRKFDNITGLTASVRLLNEKLVIYIFFLLSREFMKRPKDTNQWFFTQFNCIVKSSTGIWYILCVLYSTTGIFHIWKVKCQKQQISK